MLCAADLAKIEVVPFFHKMTFTIISITGRNNPKAVLATTITSFALSSVLTGIVFFVLGAFKLGSLVNFFPRHILIGCIGGVGFFLFVTGIEVDKDTVLLWVVPLVLAIVLATTKRFIRSPYLVPSFFLGVAATFYIIVTAVPSLHIPDLRDSGWIFAEVESGVPFYNFYTYYGEFHSTIFLTFPWRLHIEDIRAIDWKALAATIPAMFALTFFGILHVPINVPALAIAVEEDNLNLNRELVAHGISNALSGFAGSIQASLLETGHNDRQANVLIRIIWYMSTACYSSRMEGTIAWLVSC